MEFLPSDISTYVENHTSPESELLKQIERDTFAEVMMPRMLSGHLQGRVLSMLVHMLKPSQILEIGTYTGYSALCMVEGMTPLGTLVTIDINEELEERVQGYFDQSPHGHKIDYRIGNALEIIPTLKQMFDLVFIDADKDNYGKYYDLVIDKVIPGGFIIADNVLWSGKVVVAPGSKIDKDTQAILDFNEKVHRDERVENVLFPIRDGLLVIRKL